MPTPMGPIGETSRALSCILHAIDLVATRSLGDDDGNVGQLLGRGKGDIRPVRHDGISHRVGPLSVGANDFDCGLITGSCRVRIFPRDPSLNSCYHQPGIALFTVPDNNRSAFAGCFTNSATFTRSSKRPPMGGPYWEITLAERAFLIRAPGFTEYVSHRLIASDDALFFRF
jgi:hypothetical protein